MAKNKIAKRLLAILSLFLPAQAFGQTYSFVHNSITRSYIVHLPTGYTANTQYPVVINMHGYTSNATQQQSYSQMNSVADTAKFIAVYPDGVNNAWNAGYGVNSNIDDVGFISALIDTLKNKFSVNPNKVYACGMSNGGFMSYRLACQLNNKVAAIASVTGLFADSVRLFLCQNNCPVPVLDIHGTTDAVVNYNGAAGYISVDSTIGWWRQKNGCPSTPAVTNIPDINTTDGCTVTKYYYGPGLNSSEVILYKVTNGGHTWPGGFPIPSFGNTNQDIKASGEIWNFFRKHSLKCGTNAMEENISAEEIIVYPNPASGTIKITFPDRAANAHVAEAEVYNVLGEKVFSTDQTEFDISGLRQAVYFLMVKTETRIFTRMIVKH